MIKNVFQNTGLIFIYYIVISYLYAIAITYNYEIGNNIYNFIIDYSETVHELMAMYITMLISFYIGWRIIHKNYRTSTYISIEKTKSTSVIITFLLLFIDVLLLYNVYGERMFYRIEYHPDDIDYTFLAIYKIFTLLLIVYIYLNKNINNIYKFIFIFTAILVSLSIGSRITGIYLSIVFMMYIFTNTKKRIKFINILFYVTGIIFLIIFSMYSRSMDQQGLINYITHFNLFNLMDTFTLIVYYISAFSIFVTAATYDHYSEIVSINDFIIMLNPMPGYISGWYDINTEMKVLSVVPYSSVGTIFTLGYMGVFIFYFFIGMIIGYIDSTVGKFLYQKKIILAILLWSLMILFIIYHNQYTLRSSMRFIYYALLIILFNYIYRIAKSRYRKVKENV